METSTQIESRPRDTRAMAWAKTPQLPTAKPLDGVLLLAAAGIYFLVFAHLGFFRLAQLRGLTVAHLRLMTLCMAGAGMTVSLRTARALGEANVRRTLVRCFCGCGLAALASLGALGAVSFCLAATLIGGFLGGLTVSLAAILPKFFPVNRRGVFMGVGTGLAYAFCNLPPIFAGPPKLQVWLAVLSCILGMALAWSPTHPRGEIAPARMSGKDFSLGPLAAIFLMLVWLESAMFFSARAIPVLDNTGWGTAPWTSAGLYFGIACLAGVWLDNGGLPRVLALALGFLAGAAICSQARGIVGQSACWLYVAGAALYATALIFAPSRNARAGRLRDRAWEAGVLFAWAGWVGCTLGLGMGQAFHAVPLLFVGMAVTLVACAWAGKVGVPGRVFIWRAVGLLFVAVIGWAVYDSAARARRRMESREHAPAAPEQMGP